MAHQDNLQMTGVPQVRRAGVELLVIVAGVLIALGAQALWEEWSDRQRERAFLDDLLEEFEVNRQRLEADIAMTTLATAAAASLRSERFDLSADSVAKLYAASLNTARFDPLSGALRSLIDGGDLRLIQNRRLRAELAGWTDRTLEHRLTSTTVDMARGMLMPFLIREDRDWPEQAVETDRDMLEVMADQQAELMEPLLAIMTMLEEELER